MGTVLMSSKGLNSFRKRALSKRFHQSKRGGNPTPSSRFQSYRSLCSEHPLTSKMASSATSCPGKPGHVTSRSELAPPIISRQQSYSTNETRTLPGLNHFTPSSFTSVKTTMDFYLRTQRLNGYMVTSHYGITYVMVVWAVSEKKEVLSSHCIDRDIQY